MQRAIICPEELKNLLIKSFHTNLSYKDRDCRLITKMIEKSARSGPRTSPEEMYGPRDTKKEEEEEGMDSEVPIDDGIVEALENSIGAYIGAVLASNTELEKMDALEEYVFYVFVYLLQCTN